VSPVAQSGGFDEQAVANFYRGKTIRILVGFAPGGTFDLYARMLAKVLPKHIPGSPSVVVENKPGAGSMLAANLLYNAEAKDGTVIATFNESLLLQQLIGGQGIEFDVTKFQWLGSAVNQPPGCTIRSDLGITRIEELRGREIVVGATGPGTPTYDLPTALNTTLGTRFRIVTGYEGIAPIFLAFDGREVDGYCATFDTLSTVARRHVEGDNPVGRVIVLGAAEAPSHPAARGAIIAEPLAPNDQARTLLKVVAGPARVGKPLAFAPEVPADRVAALRKAVAAAFADPELVQDAQNQNLDLSPTDGERVTQIVREVMSAPPDSVAQLKEIMK
jgi:tripartite-type tricarboxylate transporter receptor subunit TctC